MGLDEFARKINEWSCSVWQYIYPGHSMCPPKFNANNKLCHQMAFANIMSLAFSEDANTRTIISYRVRHIFIPLYIPKDDLLW